MDLIVRFFILVLQGCAVGLQVGGSDSSNPADELAGIINSNRTGRGLPRLWPSPGLACIALQYIHAFQGDCEAVGRREPSPSLLNSTFSQGCGIIPATVSSIDGILLACQSRYVDPRDAFTTLLLSTSSASSIVASVRYKQLGVAISGYAGGAPYFWCAMFSGAPPNTTFLFVRGSAAPASTGCYSGAHAQCSHSYAVPPSLLLHLLIALFSFFMEF